MVLVVYLLAKSMQNQSMLNMWKPPDSTSRVQPAKPGGPEQAQVNVNL
jgi:hypothetical protein